MTKDVAVLLGSRIRAVRKKRKMSQDQLAEKINTTREYISKIERGIVNIGVDRLMEFCTALDVLSTNLLTEKTPAEGVDTREALHKLLTRATEQDLKLIYKLSNAILS